VVQKAIIDEMEGKLGLLEAENNQLQELNRKLTDDLMRYTYKDKLKEAQYIIEGQYNTLLAPQKYKYLLDESKLNFRNRYRAGVLKGHGV
jgi:hypothetical protein